MLEVAQTHLSQHQWEAYYYVSSNLNLHFFDTSLLRKADFLPQPLGQMEHTVLIFSSFLPLSPPMGSLVAAIYSQSGHRFTLLGHSNVPLKVLTRASDASEVENFFLSFPVPLLSLCQTVDFTFPKFYAKTKIEYLWGMFSVSPCCSDSSSEAG